MLFKPPLTSSLFSSNNHDSDPDLIQLFLCRMMAERPLPIPTVNLPGTLAVTCTSILQETLGQITLHRDSINISWSTFIGYPITPSISQISLEPIHLCLQLPRCTVFVGFCRWLNHHKSHAQQIHDYKWRLSTIIWEHSFFQTSTMSNTNNETYSLHEFGQPPDLSEASAPINSTTGINHRFRNNVAPIGRDKMFYLAIMWVPKLLWLSYPCRLSESCQYFWPASPSPLVHLLSGASQCKQGHHIL